MDYYEVDVSTFNYLWKLCWIGNYEFFLVILKLFFVIGNDENLFIYEKQTYLKMNYLNNWALILAQKLHQLQCILILFENVYGIYTA